MGLNCMENNPIPHLTSPLKGEGLNFEVSAQVAKGEVAKGAGCKGIRGGFGPTMITVKLYDDTLREPWDLYVSSSPEGTLFHTVGWMRAVQRSFGHTPHYLTALRRERVRGVLPLFQVKSRLFGHSLVSVPFGVYGGILASDAEVYDLLRAEAEALAARLNVDYLELRPVGRDPILATASDEAELPCGDAKRWPATPDNWHTKDLYVTFRREIYPTEQENMQAIPRKQRAMVRRGEKSGISSRIGGIEDLPLFYGIYATNVRDLGTPVFPLGFFRSLMEEFSDSFILSIWKDGKMVAGVLTFVHADALLPYYGGGLREYFDLAINDFMYWELMKYGCANGYKLFDFGRSKKDTGSYKFKKHWGFEPTNLDYQFYLVKRKELPNVSPVNPKYRLMINAWKKLPLPVANWLGPKLVRGIP